MKKNRILIIILAIFVLIAILFFGSKSENKLAGDRQTIEIKNSENETASLSEDELKEKIGQMIMVGFRGTEISENSDIVKAIKDIKVGGVALSDYDVASKSFPRNILNPKQTKKLISDLQQYSTTPLLIAVDAEGGSINRLKQTYGFSQISSPEKMGKDKTLETAQKESLKLADELKATGFNMNLAPVVDLNINPKNPIIGALGRSFSKDAEVVVNNARVFIRSHLNKNIINVEKHFPGQGSAESDSHLGLTDITKTYKDQELDPYIKLNNEELLDAVMIAHVVNQNIDSDYPATLSEKFLKTILRNQIGFKGVIISDDMQMGAIVENYKFEESIIKAINAGTDIVYFFNNNPNGYDENIAYKVRDAILNAVKEKKISEERIVESYNRIINLKKKFEIIKPTAQEIKQRNFELLNVAEKINFEEALNNAKYVESFAKIRPAFLLSIFQEELALEKFDLCYLTNFVTGDGVKAVGEKTVSKVMNPKRDIPGFLEITKELGKDPKKTLVTCPMSFGWGGAMGSADFIASTWLKYKSKIEEITGKPADPWNVKDAFLAAGLYLSESGASLKTREGEKRAAMIYFSGSESSPYTWYAEGALNISDKLEENIKVLEAN